jgi:hypothetical protein
MNTDLIVWTGYREIEAEKNMGTGPILLSAAEPSASSELTGLDAGSVAFARRIFYSVELRIVAPMERLFRRGIFFLTTTTLKKM